MTPLVSIIGLITNASSVGGVVKALKIFQNTQPVLGWQIQTASGGQYDLTGHTVKFYIHDPDSDNVEGIAILGVLSASNGSFPAILDTITITIPPASVPNPGRYQYKVRDYTTNMVYGSGPLVVDWCPTP